MPLNHSKSNKARGENIKREIEAGKDPKQAAAIAYSVQRKARRRTATGFMSRHKQKSDGTE